MYVKEKDVAVVYVRIKDFTVLLLDCVRRYMRAHPFLTWECQDRKTRGGKEGGAERELGGMKVLQAQHNCDRTSFVNVTQNIVR